MDEIRVLDAVLAFEEDGLHLLEVLFVEVQQDDVFLLEFILNDGSVQKSFERVQ
jgi:hypothetical protein